jgi:DeoR/GlpR family transcriptional regulator of sugar metabolism
MTHALQTALVLAEKPSVQVTVLGGNVLPNSLSCTGWAAEAMIEATHIDCAYLSCTGIDALRGASEVSEDQARLKKWIIRYADEICLLADDSKVGLRSNHYFADPSEISLWITNRAPGAEVAQAFAAAGALIETAKK